MSLFLSVERRKSMRWFRIRHAKIDSALRETFERYGRVAMQVVLAATNYIIHEGESLDVAQFRDHLLPWLTEQYDREERKETWSMTMEAAITVFVLAELLISVRGWLK
jgi:hypothetical protein